MGIEQLSALEIGQKIKKKELTAVEAAQACFDRMDAMESEVHAFITIDRERAMAEARRVQKGIMDGTYTGPLAGVPVAVKDNICTKGVATTCASRILENYVPPYDAHVIERLKEAGAVIIGKTNMDEFAMGSTTETSAMGITRNPRNTDHVPGGSSGGSCAAVAANEVFAALGSDTGGSIRQPSAYCGVAGMKPTYGTVSRYGLIAYASSLDQIGPVGKNVADCAALLEIISGPDRRDSTCVAGESLDFSGLWEEYKISPEAVAAGLRGMRVGVPEEYFTGGIDPQIRDAVLKAADTMKAGGAIVETFSLGMTQYMIPAYYIIACAQASSNLARFDGVKYGYRTEGAGDLHDMYKKTRAQGFGWEVKKRILLGSFVLSSGYYDAYYIKALKANRLIKEAFDRAFEKYDLILAPAAPSAAPKLGTSLTDPLKMYLSDIYTVAVNLAGLPAMSMPCGQTGSLPVGLQLIGQRFKDDIVVRGAAAYEVLRGNWMASEAPSEEVKEAL
ncbi:aspartyl-tRNA(Asn)/glutamyl-tRNA(Gln) amidotransferase subunit A [Catenibacillus scindens]|uniref:Glutamyl-tRNA(Gln) amidotransferase subunit A n=1 Tax=Catenibacillus scindens TaxID=673271 RepID=A0A7W8HA29_9FIRM|nr:Asp-tRNA(Asn)/Glu-tRNA(Gln) amidotransferase subunit GatA [Catenibacillus scindens]MBB5264674.1 aspartyl-tRNA(Asn)/glutamyl-tRNA(Gln) amidotransferase subunit A [Catenibacillus scindens]